MPLTHVLLAIAILLVSSGYISHDCFVVLGSIYYQPSVRCVLSCESRCQNDESSGAAVVADSDSENGASFNRRQSQQAAAAGSGTNGGPATDTVPLDDEDAAAADGSSEKLGRIQFTLGYDFEQSTLTLKIIRAVDLAAKDITGRSDPYVKVMLLPDKKNKLLTNIKRRNLNPRWNEVFAFEGQERLILLIVLPGDDLCRGGSMWRPGAGVLLFKICPSAPPQWRPHMGARGRCPSVQNLPQHPPVAAP